MAALKAAKGMSGMKAAGDGDGVKTTNQRKRERRQRKLMAALAKNSGRQWRKLAKRK